MANSVVITADASGTILSINHHCADMFGYTGNDLIGKNLTILMPPPYCYLHDSFLQKFRETGESHIIGSSRVVEGKHCDGTVFNIRLSVSHIILDEETLYVGLIEKIEEAVARITIDTKGIIMSVNSLCTQLFGYQPDELVGSPVNKLMPEPYSSQHDRFIRNYQTSGQQKVMNKIRNLEGLRKNGHIFPMTLKVQETNINGIIQYVAEIHDMETDDKYAVLTCDPLGTIRSCSNNLLLFFGFKNVQDILGKDISTLFPSFEIAASGKDMKRIQTAARHSDGSQFDAIIELNEFSVAGELLWSYRVTRAKALQNSHKGKGGALAATVEEPVAHAPGSTESILQGVGQYVGNYRIGKLLGSGSFGAVVLATHRLTGKLVAIKIVLANARGSNIEREIQILRKTRHKNIARLYEVITTPQRTFLIEEYVSGGELFDYVSNTVGHGLDEAEARIYFRDLLAAVDYLHSLNIIHRDLKLENLLLDAQGNVKLIDFGLSNFMKISERMNTCCGSPMYAGPEMYRRTKYEGPEVDIWSMGVILYALVVCNLPFDTPEDILKGSFVLPKQLSNDCKDLLSKMLITDPKKRITIAGIFAHPWVNHGMPIMERAPLLRTSTSDITIDPEILNTMSGAGFSANVVLASLRNNSFNQVTATYYFLEEKKLMMRMMIGQQFTPTIISSGANHHSQQQQQFPQSPQSTQAQNQVMQWNQQQGRSDKYNGYRTTLSADDSSSTTSSFTSAESSPSGLISSDSELLKSYRCKMCNYVDQEAAAADLRLAKNIQQLFSAMSQNPAAVQISKKRRADEPESISESTLMDTSDSIDSLTSKEALHKMIMDTVSQIKNMSV